MAQRNDFKWSINETLSLQKEYTLLKWTIMEIALKHKRSEKAISYKLEAEEYFMFSDNFEDDVRVQYREANTDKILAAEMQATEMQRKVNIQRKKAYKNSNAEMQRKARMYRAMQREKARHIWIVPNGYYVN